MEKRGQQHEEAINSNILPRLEKVEVNQKSHEEKMAAIEKSLIDVQMGQKDLATTVLKSGQTSTELQMQSENMITQLLSLVGNKNESETTVTIKKLDTREKIAVAFFGSLFCAGGVAGVIAVYRVKLRGKANGERSHAASINLYNYFSTYSHGICTSQ